MTVRHSACDLTGVTVSYRTYGGAEAGSEAGGVATSSGFILTIQSGTLDVSVDAQGPPGNA